jgi:cyclopropane-fatty-acyl-phospholipid synthase
MFEDVGLALLPTYFEKAMHLVKPEGVFLNHDIASCVLDEIPQSGFRDAYVFPDGELEPIQTTLPAAEEAGFEVCDVESLREQYALTLRHWIRQLEQRHTETLNYLDESTYCVWHLYLSGSHYCFETRSYTVYQTLLVKPKQKDRSGLPLMRVDPIDIKNRLYYKW